MLADSPDHPCNPTCNHKLLCTAFSIAAHLLYFYCFFFIKKVKIYIMEYHSSCLCEAARVGDIATAKQLLTDSDHPNVLVNM